MIRKLHNNLNIPADILIHETKKRSAWSIKSANARQLRPILHNWLAGKILENHGEVQIVGQVSYTLECLG
jgi:hypothetical protein